MNIIKIGTAPQAKIRERIFAITNGKFRSNLINPTIWFTSMHSLFHVYSDEGKRVPTGLKERK